MSGIDRSSPLPLWAQVLADLSDRLDAGEFVDRFPTDAELTVGYGVSRHTVREAVRRLTDEGRILRERGRGTFVTQPVIEQAPGTLYSLFRSVEAQGFTQRSEVLGLDEVTEPDVSHRLGLPSATKLVRLERIRLVDDQPLAHDVAWLPAEIAAPLLEVDFTHTALYDELSTRCGVGPTSGTERIQPLTPDSATRRLLGLAAHHAVFLIDRLTRHGPQPVEWRRTTVRGDRYAFVTRWDPTSPSATGMEPAQRETEPRSP